MPPTIQTLWDQLTPEHQALLTQLVESLAALDRDLAQAPAKSLGALLAAWEAEDSALTPEEQEAVAHDWRIMQEDLEAHRLSNRPLFP